ncbi:MAG: hypothetical protein GY820_38755 [Gammaproteobacteria bacterium]|nr:hypothetical protein [Gammaproteobacteria bacterium]
MKRYSFLFIIILLLLLPALVFGQARKRFNGGLIWNGTVNSDAFTDGGIDDEHLSATAVDGGNMLEATRTEWFPAREMTVDGTAPAAAATNGTSAQSQVEVYGFDADGGSTGDDYAFLTFVVPDDYETDSFSAVLIWETEDTDAAATDSVEWVLTVNAVANGEDRDAAGTAATATKVPVSGANEPNYIITTSIDIEVEAIVAGDLVTVNISVDESDSMLDSGETADLIGILLKWEAKDE